MLNICVLVGEKIRKRRLFKKVQTFCGQKGFEMPIRCILVC